MSAPRRHPLAKADIERESRWYNRQKPGLGDEFVDEVKRVVQVIGNQLARATNRCER